jgi:hypothetical protein
MTGDEGIYPGLSAFRFAGRDHVRSLLFVKGRKGPGDPELNMQSSQLLRIAYQTSTLPTPPRPSTLSWQIFVIGGDGEVFLCTG